jgi:hypothetical protein
MAKVEVKVLGHNSIAEAHDCPIQMKRWWVSYGRMCPHCGHRAAEKAPPPGPSDEELDRVWAEKLDGHDNFHKRAPLAGSLCFEDFDAAFPGVPDKDKTPSRYKPEHKRWFARKYLESQAAEKKEEPRALSTVSAEVEVDALKKERDEAKAALQRETARAENCRRLYLEAVGGTDLGNGLLYIPLKQPQPKGASLMRRLFKFAAISALVLGNVAHVVSPETMWASLYGERFSIYKTLHVCESCNVSGDSAICPRCGGDKVRSLVGRTVTPTFIGLGGLGEERWEAKLSGPVGQVATEK